MVLWPGLIALGWFERPKANMRDNSAQWQPDLSDYQLLSSVSHHDDKLHSCREQHGPPKPLGSVGKWPSVGQFSGFMFDCGWGRYLFFDHAVGIVTIHLNIVINKVNTQMIHVVYIIHQESTFSMTLLLRGIPGICPCHVFTPTTERTFFLRFMRTGECGGGT